MAKTTKISPYDPELYIFYTAAAAAAFSAQDYKESCTLGEHSYRLLSNHTSNLRTLIGAYYGANQVRKAKSTAHLLLSIDPKFSIKIIQKGLAIFCLRIGAKTDAVHG